MCSYWKYLVFDQEGHLCWWRKVCCKPGKKWQKRGGSEGRRGLAAVSEMLIGWPSAVTGVQFCPGVTLNDFEIQWVKCEGMNKGSTIMWLSITQPERLKLTPTHHNMGGTQWNKLVSKAQTRVIVALNSSYSQSKNSMVVEGSGEGRGSGSLINLHILFEMQRFLGRMVAAASQ